MSAKRPYQFSILGNAVVDAIARVDDAFLASHTLRKGDSNTVSPAEMLALSSTVDVQQFRSGGSAANTAYTLAKLGARVAFLGLIGEDPTGRFFAEELVAAGITVLPPTPRHRTVEVFTLLTPDGERTMVQSQPPIPNTDDTWVDETLIEQSAYLVLEAYAMANTPAAIEFAARTAAQHGTKLVVSLSARRAVQASLPLLTDLALAYKPFIIGHATEWQMLLDGNDPHTADRLNACPRVLTRSGDGASFRDTDGTLTDSLTQPIATPVDVSGAGDAFAAGFLYTFTGGGSAQLALQAGNQLGRKLVLQLGPRLQSLPELADPDSHHLSSN